MIASPVFTARCAAADSVRRSLRRPASTRGCRHRSPARKRLPRHTPDRPGERSKSPAVRPKSRAAFGCAGSRQFSTRGQHRPGSTEPGHVDGGVVAGRLARQKIAPGFNRSLGLPDIIEESVFAVKAAPAAALEQFGEVFKPPLGKSAPARDNVAAACHVAFEMS